MSEADRVFGYTDEIDVTRGASLSAVPRNCVLFRADKFLA